jgi:poly(hydroxyalkanoate) depolymerase family esterase
LSFYKPISGKESNMAHDKSTHLSEVIGFGTNPGALRSWLFLPSVLSPRTPLVVALHGCTQTAASYDHGAGWTQLAEAKGFAVLLPEQRRENNGNQCFNWFEPTDTKRGSGEALSIREMISHVVIAHGIDPRRVFITGLSAGGAMANVMLATYPDVFAGGAIVGGLPYGVAENVGQAFERMQGRNPPSADMLHRALANASGNNGPWPSVSIWHGAHDQTVKPINAQQIANQWLSVRGLRSAPDLVDTVNGHGLQAWRDDTGKAAVEIYMIKGMAHGVPLSAGGDVPIGHTGPFMLEAGISSTARIARSWGLTDDSDVAQAEGAIPSASSPASSPDSIQTIVEKAMAFAKTGKAKASGMSAGDKETGVSKVINDALRAAGLLR